MAAQKKAGRQGGLMHLPLQPLGYSPLHEPLLLFYYPAASNIRADGVPYLLQAQTSNMCWHVQCT